MASAASLRVLGLTAKATQAQVKSAYRLLAKEWHPDKHQGRAKAAAEARFKQIVGAYEQLSSGAADSEDAARTGYSGGMQWPGGVHGPGRHAQGSGTRRDGPQRGSAYESWGTREQYGEAHRAGYNPYRGYMDFDPQTPAGEARARTEQQQTTRSRLSLGLFVFGFGAIVWTARRDNRRLEKGELVEAFFNNGTRRWEAATPAMRKDPLLSTLVHLKPPSVVYGHGITGNGGTGANKGSRKQAQTLDGRNVADAYRAGSQGTR